MVEPDHRLARAIAQGKRQRAEKKRHAGGRPTKKTDVNQLRRQMTFRFCWVTIGAKNLADFVRRVDTRDPKQSRAMWRHYAKASFDFADEYIELMDAAAPGTRELWESKFWPLLEKEEHDEKWLVAVVTALPTVFVDRILSSVQEPGEILSLSKHQYFPNGDKAVQMLGSLAAVSALLALAHLCERSKGPDDAFGPATTGAELYVRISMNSPLGEFLPQIWPLLQKRFLDRVGPWELKSRHPDGHHSYQRLRSNYEAVIQACEARGLALSSARHRIEFLCLSSRMIHEILRAVNELESYPNPEVRQLHGKVLDTLIEEYNRYQAFKKTPVRQSLYYPEEHLIAFNHRIGALRIKMIDAEDRERNAKARAAVAEFERQRSMRASSSKPRKRGGAKSQRKAKPEI